jgi:hypothetical protein
MSNLKEQAYRWIVGKYMIPNALPQADKIIQDLLITVEQLEQCNAHANEQLVTKQAIIDNYNLDMLLDVFTKELEKQIKAAFKDGQSQGLSEAATYVRNLPGNLCKWIADDIINLAGK